MSLRKDILECDKALNIYAELCTGSSNARIFFAVSIHGMFVAVNKKICNHLEALDRNECTEVLGLDFNKMKNPDYWLHNGKVKQILQALPPNAALDALSIVCDREHLKIKDVMDIYQLLEEDVEVFISLITEAREKTLKAPLCTFENFFHKMCDRIDVNQIQTEHEEWKMNASDLTFEILKDKQVQVVHDFLLNNFFEWANKPATWEMEYVDLERVKKHLPYGTNLPKEFMGYCAQWRRYTSWCSDILILHCGKLGKYLYMCDGKLKPEKKDELFKLYYKLQFIHQDMVRIKPELEQYLMEDNGSIEGTRYFGIGKSITLLLTKDWFNAMRTEKKYNAAWIERFVNALLLSEWRDDIADDWKKQDKRISVLGYIIGCLISAGVLKDNDAAIASAVVKHIHFKDRSFGVYIGRGKKKPYCEWVCDYVKTH